ncbi:NUDIX hydrolase [Desertibacillus haloalkaliphilus]|uniref:NUDIX hydrolase n=1 Tax=Desertibacillus haloalkaliphilus TaxID=1328930 RepID=UPI001C2514EB|nr:CoA pyrophosphatase [Desertibacillus haloalkaliphilus]MBU8905553.1 CoA pyrophosphatase [Desertibacillus haloalkaliphilus]
MSVESIKNQLQGRKAKILGHENFLKSAVMIPLIERNGEINLLFEVRSHQLRRQPGEICFPGGKVDESDKDEEHTAIRELCEELGLPANQINTVASLDYVVTPFDSLIYPFVGEIAPHAVISHNPLEVDEVFYVPLDYFLEAKPQRFDINLKVEPEKNFPYHLIPNGKNYNWRVGAIPEYFYEYNDYVIWGLTARILHHFLELIRTNV